MKHILTFILFTIICQFVKSQCTPNGITTNPAAPVNNQLPSKTNLNFDWRQPGWQNNTTCQPLSQVESPFFKTDNLEILRASKDMLPEDGWELIRRDFGYTDQNTPRPEVPEHSYFILYNKYSGVLRILLKTCRVVDYNGTKITLRFDATSSFQTALLNFTSTTKAVDIPHTKNPAAQSASVFVNDQTKWFYADFPMAYDPCTCNYNSKINIISQLIQNSSIALQGSITGTITSIQNGQGSVANDGSYSFKDFADDADKFKKGYSSVDNFITETKNVAATIPNSTAVQNALTNLQTALKDNQIFKTGLAAVPWIKSAVGLLDFFSGGGKSSAQQVQIMPMAVNLSLKVDGTMTTSNQYHNIIFTTPGSLNAQNDPDIYPFYNEPLGVFNLLNGPVMSTRLSASPLPGTGLWNQNWTFKMKQPIKWVLNPSSGLEIQDAQIAYVVQSLDNSSTPPETLPVPGISPSTPNASQGFNFFEGIDAQTGRKEYRTDYVNFSCLGNEHKFSFTRLGVPIPNLTAVGDFFIKVILNLRRTNNPSAQNVLVVLKYPMPQELVSTTLSGDVFNPASCNGGMVSQASTSDINSFCISSIYTSNRNNRISTVTPVSERNSTYNLAISPNPAVGKIVIKGDVQDKTIKSVQLYNTTGSESFEQILGIGGNINKEIDISKLSKGLYFIKILFSDGQSVVKKVIIIK